MCECEAQVCALAFPFSGTALPLRAMLCCVSVFVCVVYAAAISCARLRNARAFALYHPRTISLLCISTVHYARCVQIDIDLNDPEVEKAATKIQASFRGYKTRKETRDN